MKGILKILVLLVVVAVASVPIASAGDLPENAFAEPAVGHRGGLVFETDGATDGNNEGDPDTLGDGLGYDDPSKIMGGSSSCEEVDPGWIEFVLSILRQLQNLP